MSNVYRVKIRRRMPKWAVERHDLFISVSNIEDHCGVSLCKVINNFDEYAQKIEYLGPFPKRAELLALLDHYFPEVPNA